MDRDWRTNCINQWLTDRRTDCLTNWLTDRQTDRQADCLHNDLIDRPRATDEPTDRTTGWRIDYLKIKAEKKKNYEIEKRQSTILPRRSSVLLGSIFFSWSLFQTYSELLYLFSHSFVKFLPSLRHPLLIVSPSESTLPHGKKLRLPPPIATSRPSPCGYSINWRAVWEEKGVKWEISTSARLKCLWSEN